MDRLEAIEFQMDRQEAIAELKDFMDNVGSDVEFGDIPLCSIAQAISDMQAIADGRMVEVGKDKEPFEAYINVNLKGE